MNKKFSTLAVAAMLASAFTAYAGPGDVVTKLAQGNNGKQYQLVTADGEYLALDETDGELLLVSDPNAWNNGTEFVSILGKSLWCVDVTLENQGKNPIFDFINKGEGSVLDVTVGGWNTDWGKTDDELGKLSNKVATVGGEISGWEFTPVLGSDAVPMFGKDGGTAYALYSYISSNYFATLVKDDNDKVKVAVYPATVNKNEIVNQLKFVLKEADDVNLTAAQFNTILDTQKATETVKMTFDKDYNNTNIINPFSTNEFNAEYAENNFVYLYKKEADGSKNYLRVDTAYANGYGTKFLTFAFAKFKDADGVLGEGDPSSDDIIPDQYKFRLNYCPTDDSLSIQVKSVLYKVNESSQSPKGAKWWSDGRTVLSGNDAELKKEFYTRTWMQQLNQAGSLTSNGVAGVAGNTNYVKLQDLELSTESRIVTIGQEPINTHISFGYGDCASVASEYTSVADGVYYIKNAKGQYLTYPIYVGKDGQPQFVTVNADEQDVAHMPAFQWVVLKKYTDAGAPTSPIKMANREFNKDFTTFGNIQLKKAAGATYMYTTSDIAVADGVQIDSLLFEAVPQSSIEDPYLGYKKITKEELMANKYTFNYWHPYAQDKYIAQAENDSTFSVWNEISAFNIDTVAYNLSYKAKYNAVSDAEYGYVTETGTDKIVDKSTVDIPYGFEITNEVKWSNGSLRIKGLTGLVRTAYKISLNGSEWKVNENDQFNTGKNSWAYNKQNENAGVQTYDEYVVFLKENMHVDGHHYYAILNAGKQVDENTPNRVLVEQFVEKDGKLESLGYELYQDIYKPVYKDNDPNKELLYYTNAEFIVQPFKAGVSDYDGAATLKNQPLTETRTSSFAIEPDNTPLYRRFNSTLEGQAGDGVDTLRFYEKYRGEYLMIEANKNFMVEHIDFLGIDAQDKAQGGLAFIVDTAWVNRGFGNLKPQYLISIDRHDKAATEGVPCTYEHNHYDNQGNAVDAAHCSHAIPATPGFARGKYLINFERFANDKDMVKADDYKWAGYTRAGFKEAVVVEDTLYVLRDEFKNLPNEEITVEKLASAEVEALRAWTKAGNDAKDFLSYKYELAGDQHKYATWSMRFVDRANAANEVESDRAFLFESMNSSLNEDEAQWIAPEKAAWLKMQNGCLVLSDEATSKFNEVVTGGDDALIFNVEHVCGDKVAVDNENIAVEGVSVVAGNGQVTIMGAAGKNVTITNILGKVIASQVIASDNATIAVPAGIVAVAVEGEAAVKAIVK